MVMEIATDKGNGMEFRNDQLISDTSKYSLKADSVSGNLTIQDLQQDDSGLYICSVRIFKDVEGSSVRLEVLLPAKPRSLSISDNQSEIENNVESISITLGQTHKIMCVVQEIRPPATLEWINPGRVTVRQDDQYNTIHGVTYTSIRTVLITPSRHDDGKILRCIASHRELDHDINSTVRLSVQYSPVIVDSSVRRVFNIRPKVDAILTCRSDSRPIASITWLSYGTEHKNDARHQNTLHLLLHS
ncbi:nectin-2-like [Lytechinus variegatus]|uniref:nectin-2-like n=1 Tax=Lytechinus variegatus TaxID=7654 RepID=UPI001BB0D87B|nr:nectin-2-like [Lytechinus variegatus]